MLNQAVFMGRLTAPIEIRTTQSGKTVGGFTLAVNRNGKDKETDFIPCTAWEHTATFIERYFGKGSLIAVTGRMQSRRWEDKNGNKRTSIECLVNSVDFTGEKAAQKEPEEDFSAYDGNPDDLPY